MDGVREMTIREELEKLDLDQHDIDRIIHKYDNEKAKAKEIAYNEAREFRAIAERQAVEIKALVGYIAFKDL